MMRNFLLTAAMCFTFLSCEKSEEEKKDLGKDAAIEFCDCYEKNSRDECLDRLKSNYSSADYTSDEFISAFNKQSTCGIKLEKKYISSKAMLGNNIFILLTRGAFRKIRKKLLTIN